MEKLTDSVSPEAHFDTAEDAQTVADQVRVALLRRATAMRRGIDLGQQSLKSFEMSAYGKQYVADLLKVHAVQEDHLGIGPVQSMSTPKPVEQFYARIWNAGDLDAASDLLTARFSFRGSLEHLRRCGFPVAILPDFGVTNQLASRSIGLVLLCFDSKAPASQNCGFLGISLDLMRYSRKAG